MTNVKIQMTSDKKYDLGERTAIFGESIIKFAKRIPVNEVAKPLIGQVVRSGTSVGANYCEADCAGSKKDFKHRISICNKETKETKHWLRMIAVSAPDLKEEARGLWKEVNELNLIFSAINRNTKVLSK